MPKKRTETAIAKVEGMILEIRGQKVILDSDLAALYGVETKGLNQAVKRNIDKFPEDFVYRLDRKEAMALKSQIATSNTANRSQFVTGSQKHRDPRNLPYVFTEHGAIMAANVLRSPKAVQMSVFVVRAFIKMREMLVAQHDLARQLTSLEKKLTKRLDSHESAIVDVLRKLMLLLNPPAPPPPPPPKKVTGFKIKEKRASYRTKKARTSRTK